MGDSRDQFSDTPWETKCTITLLFCKVTRYFVDERAPCCCEPQLVQQFLRAVMSSDGVVPLMALGNTMWGYCLFLERGTDSRFYPGNIFYVFLFSSLSFHTHFRILTSNFFSIYSCLLHILLSVWLVSGCM